MKILGTLILLAGALLFLIGLGGAVVNFVFPPTAATCRTAEAKLKEAEAAVKAYEAAKGTPDESDRKFTVDLAIKSASGWSESCGRMKETYRFYGLVFTAVALVGGFTFLIGGAITLLAFRRRKALA